MTSQHYAKGAGLALTLAALGLSACSANHHSIYRWQPVATAEASYTLVDAKQRAIIGVPRPLTIVPPKQGQTPPEKQKFVVCAEPSPDVFSALAQSLAASGSLGKSADPAALQLAGSLAGTSSEQASTLARTQTVNMLREVMYRTCERYMNGAISELEMPVQAIRDQRMMVSTLAIEQLTAAARPMVVVIGGGGTASAGSSTQDAVLKYSQARDAVVAAEKVKKDKQDAYDAMKEACLAIDKKVTDGTDLTADEKKKQGECSTAKLALTSAETDLKTKSDHYVNLGKVASQGGAGPASASGALMTPVIEGGAQAQAAAIETVAVVVGEIVRRNYDQQGEILMVCLKVIQSDDAKFNASRPFCNDLLKQSIETAKAEAAADAAEADAKAATFKLEVIDARKILLARTGTRFDKFWLKVAGAEGKALDAGRLAETIDAYVKAHPKSSPKLPAMKRLSTMKTMTTRAALSDAFLALPFEYQTELAN